MLLADQQTPWLGILGGIAVLSALVGGALLLYRGYERLARGALLRAYRGIDILPEPQPGDVWISYHTYHGLVAWFTQSHHQLHLPPDQARMLLGRLLRFNLCWGSLTYGSLFAIPLAIMNYLGERRSIEKQTQGEAVAGATPATTEGVVDRSLPAADAFDSPATEPDAIRSSWKCVLGRILVGLCGLFAISSVVSLVRGDFAAAGAGIVVTILFGVIARDWLGGRSS